MKPQRPSLMLNSPPRKSLKGARDSFQEARDTLSSPARGTRSKGDGIGPRPARVPLSASTEVAGFDTSGDGRVDALDTNSDGRIDTVLKALEGGAPLSAAGYKPVKVDFNPGQGGGGAGHRVRAPSESVVGFDTTGDGLVDALDTTGDGKIDTLLMRKRAVLTLGLEEWEELEEQRAGLHGYHGGDFRSRSTWLHAAAKRLLFSTGGALLKLPLLISLFALALWGSWRVTPWHDDAVAAWRETLRVLLVADATIWADTGCRAW